MGHPRLYGCGTRASYAYGCRCERCTEASRLYHLEWRLDRMVGKERVRDHGWDRTMPPQGEWVAAAACRDSDPALWFQEGRGTSSYLEARKVCFSCPVREECLGWALEAGVQDGMWGGLNPTQRRTRRREQGLFSPRQRREPRVEEVDVRGEVL